MQNSWVLADIFIVDHSVGMAISLFSMSRESPRAAKLVSLWPDDLSPIDKMFLHGEKRKRREGNTANAIRRGGACVDLWRKRLHLVNRNVTGHIFTFPIQKQMH